jgi:hypothetical protein
MLDRYRSCLEGTRERQKGSLNATRKFECNSAGLKLDCLQWSGEDEIRTCRDLFEAIKSFFKDNPTWE